MKQTENSKSAIVLFALVLLVITLCGATGTSAQGLGGATTKFKRSKATTYELVVENVYFFHVSKYLEPTEIIPLKKPEQTSYQTPEDVNLANISAMLAGDWDWFLLTFSPEAQKWISNSNKKEGRTGKWWVEMWKKGFEGMRIFLNDRTESGDYVTITYFVVSPDTGRKTKMPRIFKKTKDGKWLATRDLPGNDPVSITPWPWPKGQTTRRERRVIRK